MEGFVYGGLDHYVNAFNAIAMMMGNSVIDSLIRLVMLIGLAMVIVSAAFSLNLKETFMWFAGALLIMAVILVPRTTVIIHDRLSVGAPVAVDNVPMAVGLVFSLSSTIGDAATQLTETVFPHPEAAQYSQTGLIYGSRVLRETTMLRWPDQYFAANMDSYVVRCVMHDLHTHHYSMHDLGTAPDLFDFITVSPHGGLATQWINPDGTRETIGCIQAANQLRASREAMADQAANRFGRVVHPDLAGPLAETTIRVNVEGAHAFIMDQSRTAADVFIQAMTINSVRDAQLSAAAESGVDISAYSMTRAEQQSRTQNFMSAEMAHKWIPLLRVVLEIIFYSMFPLMAPFFLLPKFGPQLLKKYFSGFLILQAWGPLFVILNGIMMHHIAEASRAAGYDANEGYAGVTLASMDGVAGINGDLASIAGWMTMMIPVMATMLAFGVDRLAMQSNSLLNSVSGAAQQAAADQTVGNMNLATTAFDTHRFNQTFGNQHVTSGDVNMGHWNERTAGGSLISHHADGKSVVNMNETVSQTPWNVQQRQSYGQSARTMSSEARQQADTHTQMAGTNYGRAFDAMYNQASNSSEGLSAAIRYDTSEGLGIRDEITNMEGRITEAAQRVLEARQTSSSQHGELYADAYGGVRGEAGLSVLGNSAQLVGQAIIGGRGSAAWDRMDSDAREIYSQLSDSDRQEFGQIASRIIEAQRRGDISIVNGDDRSEGSSINEAFRMGHSYSEQASQMMEYSERLERVAEQAENNEFSFQMPSDDRFLEFMADRGYRSPDDVSALYRNDQPAFANHLDNFTREQVARMGGFSLQEMDLGGVSSGFDSLMNTGPGVVAAYHDGVANTQSEIARELNPSNVTGFRMDTDSLEGAAGELAAGVGIDRGNIGDVVEQRLNAGLEDRPMRDLPELPGGGDNGPPDWMRSGNEERPYENWNEGQIEQRMAWIDEQRGSGSRGALGFNRGDLELGQERRALEAELGRREGETDAGSSGSTSAAAMMFPGGGSRPGDLIAAEHRRGSGQNWGGSAGGTGQAASANNRAPRGSVDVDDMNNAPPMPQRVPRG